MSASSKPPATAGNLTGCGKWYQTSSFSAEPEPALMNDSNVLSNLRLASIENVLLLMSDPV